MFALTTDEWDVHQYFSMFGTTGKRLLHLRYSPCTTGYQLGIDDRPERRFCVPALSSPAARWSTLPSCSGSRAPFRGAGSRNLSPELLPIPFKTKRSKERFPGLGDPMNTRHTVTWLFGDAGYLALAGSC